MVERLLDERERSVVRARRSPLYCIAQLLYCAAGWPMAWIMISVAIGDASRFSPWPSLCRMLVHGLDQVIRKVCMPAAIWLKP